MDKRAWVHQLKKQVEKKGEDSASWYVSFYDPDGALRTKSCGPGKIGKTAAEKVADITHSQLVTGTYETNRRSEWDKFHVRYKEHVAGFKRERSRKAALLSIATFVRIAKPKKMASIKTEKIDKFIADRLKETVTNKKRQTVRDISPATVNRELRYVRAALRLAEDWGFIPKVPKFRFLKVPDKLPTYVTPEHLAAIVESCDVATMPADLPNITSAEWWRALILTLYMTGWRIGQTMALKWTDVDFIEGTIFTAAEDNKGARDQVTPMHALISQYLRPLEGTFDAYVFPWNQNPRTLWAEFERIQIAAKLADGSPMPKLGKKGGWYGFHDLRRSFATENAASLDLLELKALMQHKSLTTTQGYVNMAKRLAKPVANLFVPALRVAESG